jgi:protocatechuate 3,4-dioxygenase, alpha subunit
VPNIPLPSQTVGPFFHLGCTDHHRVESLISAGTKGDRIRLKICVLDGEGLPVPDAMIEIWQADSEGKYAHPDDPQHATADPSFKGFGRMATNDQGCCVFETIRPGQVAANNGGKQASHVNISVFARGILKRLATRAYFAGDPALHQDTVLARVPGERQNTLLLQSSPARPAEWYFEIHLCGENETVFFDV